MPGDLPAADTAIILMAAGIGRRFGSNKLLAPFRGRPLWEYAWERAVEAKKELGIQVLMVSGYQPLLQAPEVIPVCNDLPLLGASHTVRLGVKEAEKLGMQYAVFMVSDQPMLKTSSLKRLIEAREPGKIVCLSKDGRAGNPVVFHRDFFPELLALTGDRGGKMVMHRHMDAVKWVEADEMSELTDIDTAASADAVQPL
ncbi:MAG TPA: nucleotidyltransferase family protein [Candidatus Faecivivens stercoripullorum]|uniref:Nucleotidyltransferase family protein n=1 Tax=Candidatus Faecivivens stercoripullorum TaxID=2840805 RepID=A0A9D1H9F1_9FIRM|nr:nucleotidyltransferase family protein [Candidatus Faecivivens stercoripullorum]